jgi:hypothetical protein
METLTSRQAADRLGVNVQKFHRLIVGTGIIPVVKAPGLRGAKFWAVDDIEALADRNGEAVA